jgi:hypothetical protein
MPASTPIYGITYPCGGDTIDSAVLETFARSVDAALAQGRADLARATGRPNALVYTTTSQAVVINTATELGFDGSSSDYDNDDMVNLSTNNGPAIVTPGAYLVWGELWITDGFTTLTSASAIITVNGIERARHITSSDDIDYAVTVPLLLAAGDVVELQALWTGTGGPANVTARALAVSFLSAAP